MNLPDNTITPAEVAEFLRKTAAAFDAMPEGPIPGALMALDVSLNLHRYTDDHTTNGALMAFADAIGTAAGGAPASLDGAVYTTPMPDCPAALNFRVKAFLKTSTPTVHIDPAI